MAQYYWEPNIEDEGNHPTDITTSMIYNSGGSLIVRDDVNGYGDPVALSWVRTNTAAGLSGFTLNSINGVDLTNLSGEIEVYVYFRTVGASSDGFVSAFADPGSPYPVVNCIRSRFGSDARFAIRRFTSATAQSIIGDFIGSSTTDPVYDTGNHQTKVRLGFSPDYVRAKMWGREGVADDEPESWTLSEDYPSGERTSGRISLGRRRDVSNANFSLDIFAIGIGTDGDPAPTEYPAVGLPVLSLPELIDIGPFQATPKVRLDYP